MGLARLAAPLPPGARGLRPHAARVRGVRAGAGDEPEGGRGRSRVRLIPRTRGGALWRFGLAAVIVVLFAAATTAVAGLLQVQGVVNDLNLSPSLAHADVKLPPAGAPETLLLIGSDHRAG